MSNELQADHLVSKTVYAVIENPAVAGQHWNTDGTPAFEDHDDANWSDYGVPLSAAAFGASGVYLGDFPAGITARGFYPVKFYEQLTGSRLITDLKIGAAIVEWTGSAQVVGLDLTTPVPTSNTAHTLGDCLNAARAQGFGKWVINGTTLTLYASDGTTVVRTFTLDSASNPTSRT